VNPLYVSVVGACGVAGALPSLPGANSPANDNSGGSFLDTIGGFFKGAGSDALDALKYVGNGIESGAGSLASGAGSYLSTLGPAVASLFGAASGGSFQVGASTALGSMNGTDNRLIAFRARDGENVSVTPPGQRAGGGGGVVQNFNISTPDASSFRASQGQILSNGVVAANRAARRNNL
jgi:hypothetical protein